MSFHCVNSRLTESIKHKASMYSRTKDIVVDGIFFGCIYT